MKRRTEVIDPINLCSHCPHPVIDIGRVMFCPCEDCHYGGLVQGREPKDNHTVAVAASRFNPSGTAPYTWHRPECPFYGQPEGEEPDDRCICRATTTTVIIETPAADDGEVWVDPVHRVG